MSMNIFVLFCWECDMILLWLQVGANAGVIGMAKEHLGLALALSVPVFVVVTKVDMCPPNVLQETLKILQKVLKSPGVRKIPVLVQNPDDVICSATNFSSERYYSANKVSSVFLQSPPHKHFKICFQQLTAAYQYKMVRNETNFVYGIQNGQKRVTQGNYGTQWSFLLKYTMLRNVKKSFSLIKK